MNAQQFDTAVHAEAPQEPQAALTERGIRAPQEPPAALNERGIRVWQEPPVALAERASGYGRNCRQPWPRGRQGMAGTAGSPGREGVRYGGVPAGRAAEISREGESYESV